MNKTILTLDTAASKYTFKVEAAKAFGEVHVTISAFLPNSPARKAITAKTVAELFALIPSEAVPAIVKSLEAMVESAEMLAR